jgi:rubrerythrin
MRQDHLNELLYQALETEQGGIDVYTVAVECALTEDLREEWEEYLAQTRNHERILRETMEALGLDPDQETPGRAVARHQGESLVQAIEMARTAGDDDAAQLVAAECVVLAETRDHMNWELLGEAAQNLEGDEASALEKACEEVEDEEDEHLYHTMGWTRELWIDCLGLPAALPPPEEQRDVTSDLEAARARRDRQQMVAGKRSRRGA